MRNGQAKSDGKQPKYLQVKTALTEAITRGDYEPGVRLPSTKALSEQLEVSLVTVHRAMQEMVREGLLRREQGRGTFVNAHHESVREQRVRCRVGLILHAEASMGDHFHGSLLDGVRQRARELNVDLVMLRFEDDLRNECDAYLCVNPYRDRLEAMLRREGRAGPVLSLCSSFDLPGVSVVDSKNREIMRTAFEHLWELGHRRIGFVGGAEQLGNSHDRRLGYVDALQAHGVEAEAPPMLTVESWNLTGAEREKLAELMSGTGRPTAVLAAGFYYALGVIDVAKNLGLAIPDDLSLIGFDDPPSASHLSPPLTTIRQPLAEMGALGVELLLRMLTENDAKPTQRFVDCQLVPRESTAPPERISGETVIRSSRKGTLK
jgi:DNA-binding LacI/PurR family transcriptional regulator